MNKRTVSLNDFRMNGKDGYFDGIREPIFYDCSDDEIRLFFLELGKKAFKFNYLDMLIMGFTDKSRSKQDHEFIGMGIARLTHLFGEEMIKKEFRYDFSSIEEEYYPKYLEYERKKQEKVRNNTAKEPENI